MDSEGSATSEDGSCDFETISPGRVPGPGNTMQAPHINVVGIMRGALLKRLSTRVYFDGDSANDARFRACVSAETETATLFAHPDQAREGGWTNEIRLAWREARRCFSMCEPPSYERIVRLTAQSLPGAGAGPIMSMRLIDSLATTPSWPSCFPMSRSLRPCWILNRRWPRAEPEPESSQIAQQDIVTALAKPGSFHAAALSIAASSGNALRSLL